MKSYAVWQSLFGLVKKGTDQEDMWAQMRENISQQRLNWSSSQSHSGLLCLALLMMPVTSREL